MPVQAHGQVREIGSQKEKGDEHETLQPATASEAFGEIAKSGGDSEAKNEKEHQYAERVRNEIQRVAGTRVGHCFFVAVFGQSVLLSFAARRLGAFGLGQAGNGSLRGSGTIGRGLGVDGTRQRYGWV